MLAAVYRRAALVLQPSEREGFGLPVAEAMACGTPVVASLLSALCEVGGHAADVLPGRRSARVDRAVAACSTSACGGPEIWARRQADSLHASRRFDALAHARGMLRCIARCSRAAFRTSWSQDGEDRPLQEALVAAR